MNYRVTTRCTYTKLSCLSLPEAKWDQSAGEVLVNVQRKHLYRFQVADVSGNIFLPTPTGTAVVQVYIDLGFPYFLVGAIDPSDSLYNTPLIVHRRGQSPDTIRLPAELAISVSGALVQGASLSELGRRLYLDDSCLYIRHKQAFYSVNLATHAVRTKQDLFPSHWLRLSLKKAY